MPVVAKENTIYGDDSINPVGTNGFEFLEYAAEDPQTLRDLFTQLDFTKVAQHKTKAIELWRQGNINFLINAEPKEAAAEFARQHGPCVCGMAFRVKDAKQALEHSLEKGGKACPKQADCWAPESVTTIHGIGGSTLYFVDQFIDTNIYDDTFDFTPGITLNTTNTTLLDIDHVTHNVYQGHMDEWASFYENLFNFREIRHFDISGKLTGLQSRAMTSPCNKIRIPINEPTDDKSQISEYLNEYKGEGIQHIAMTTNDIYATVEHLKEKGIAFLDTPDTYYHNVTKRLPHHQEPLDRMQKNRILIDGSPEKDGGILLQIFTNTVIGPVFFEIIQRKGDQGFGEGNFQALFESMEQDQIERGVLTEK